MENADPKAAAGRTWQEFLRTTLATAGSVLGANEALAAGRKLAIRPEEFLA